MTDAALPVTERAVERFAEAYLTSLGAEIRKEGRQWWVELPEDAATELDLDGAVLEITDDPAEVGDEALAIAPESPFVERMLDEAADRTPVGSLSLTGDQVEIKLPPWLTDGSVDVVERSFTPYYDRRAICALFHVGIETVSEYETDELRAVAVDRNDLESRPRLAETYLDLAERMDGTLSSGGSFAPDTVRECLEAAQEIAKDDVGSVVEETRHRATRASEVELEEYREYVNQRLDELNGEIDRLSDRIEEATEKVDTSSEQSERVAALRERKRLRAERDELREERDELQTAIDAGFPERRREIRDRHALTVRIRPVTLTGVKYERGDLELTLNDGDTVVTETFPFAVGSGILDEQQCDRCGTALSKDNPLALDGRYIRGEDCC